MSMEKRIISSLQKFIAFQSLSGSLLVNDFQHTQTQFPSRIFLNSEPSFHLGKVLELAN